MSANGGDLGAGVGGGEDGAGGEITINSGNSDTEYAYEGEIVTLTMDRSRRKESGDNGS